MDNQSPSLASATFDYYGDGLRAWKQTDGGTRTYFLYDGTYPVCEMDSSGNLTSVNTFGAQGLLSERLVSINATNFYTFDERGNVAQRTNAGGGPHGSDLYDGYGRSRNGSPSDVWGFGGQWGDYTDTETGLVLMTHRFYDPQAGRFTTRDPIGYGGGLNLYAYCGNDPINRIDPLGFCGGDGRDIWNDIADGLHTGLNGALSAASTFTNWSQFWTYDGGSSRNDPDFAGGRNLGLAGLTAASFAIPGGGEERAVEEALEVVSPAQMVRDLLPLELKDAASKAFRDNSKLTAMSPEDREIAAQAYEKIAPHTVNRDQELTRLYNLERAKFLRGEVDRIAGTAPEFAKEIGYHP